MIINHNIAALNTYRQLGSVSSASGKSLEKLSSGLRINRAGDDAAGLAISEKMRGQIRGLEQANRNAQDGISLLQTAEGALNETHSILQRMRELAVQSSNETLTQDDRDSIQDEVSRLKSEIDRISSTTEFNSKKLLNGSIDEARNAQGTKLESSDYTTASASAVITGGTALDATTRIVTGMNDELQLTLTDAQGNTLNSGATTITIAAGSYSRDALVSAVNDAINDTGLSGTVRASYDSGTNVLSFVTTDVGSSASVQIDHASTAAESALTALGFRTDEGSADGSVDFSGGAVDLSAAANQVFSLVVGGKTAQIDIGGEAGIDAAVAIADLETALQTKIDAAFGSDVVTVGDDGSGHITLTANAAYSISVAQDGVNTGHTAIFGGAVATAGSATDDVLTVGVANTGSAAGTATGATTLINLADSDGNDFGLAAGNVIEIQGVKGGASFTASLTISAITTTADLATSIQNAIGGNATVAWNNTTKEFNVTGDSGVASGITNLKLTAEVSSTDSTAIQKFNDYFSAFEETQTAQDTHTDSSLQMQIGSNKDQTMKVAIREMSTTSLSLGSLDASTTTGANFGVSILDNAIVEVNSERSKLGALQNRLEHTINNLGTSAENLTAAESRIRDVDMAKEMMEFTKNNIISQAATAMLAQANQQPQQVLQLLR